MSRDAEQPPAWRIAAAFIIAPLVPAALFSFDKPLYGDFLKSVSVVALVGGYPAAFLLGAPALLILRRRVAPTLLNIALIGALVAALPWAVLLLLAPNPDYAVLGSHIAVLDGRRTLWGWLEYARFVASVFALGLLGGAAFWLVAVGRRGKPRTAEA